MYILDTDHLGIIQAHTRPEFDRLWPRVSARPVTDFFTTIISFHEQVTGWNAYLARASDQQAVVRAYRMFQRILSDFAAAQVLPFDARAAAKFEELRTARVRVPTMDLRIAAIAITTGFTLLSRNLADFRQVPGLTVEDWTN